MPFLPPVTALPRPALAKFARGVPPAGPCSLRGVPPPYVLAFPHHSEGDIYLSSEKAVGTVLRWHYGKGAEQECSAKLLTRVQLMLSRTTPTVALEVRETEDLGAQLDDGAGRCHPETMV